MKIEITILKEDMGHGVYRKAATCPITKALARAGHPNLRDIGNIIRDETTGNIIHVNNQSVYTDMTRKVVRMDTSTDEHKLYPLEAETFTVTIDIDQPSN